MDVAVVIRIDISFLLLSVSVSVVLLTFTKDFPKERYNTYAKSCNLMLSTAPPIRGQFSENYFIHNVISYQAIHF